MLTSRKVSVPVAGKTVSAQGILLNLIYCQLTPSFAYWFGYWGWERRLKLRKHFLKFGLAVVKLGWGRWLTAVSWPTMMGMGSTTCPTAGPPAALHHPDLPRVPSTPPESQLTCKKAPRSSLQHKYTETIWSIGIVISLQRFRNSMFISCNHSKIFIQMNSHKYSM